jgi:hypothetical protein
MMRALLLVACLAQAQGVTERFATIDGIVTDSTMRPLQNVSVSILRTAVEVKTGDNGRFRILQLPPGDYVIIVRRVGFSPVSAVIRATPGDTLRTSYELGPSPINLPGVTITEERRGWREMEFEVRRKRGLGEFMSKEQIDKKSASSATQLFYWFNAIRVVEAGNGAIVDHYAVAKRGATSIKTTPCRAARILLDGIPMPDPMNLDYLPLARELAGIEVYGEVAAAPPEYAIYDKGCGLILIWRRM